MVTVTEGSTPDAPGGWQRSVVGGAGILVVICALLYVPPALRTPFFTKGEPREALVVRRMVEDGDWILPKRASAGGWAIASKPPLYHWLAAGTVTVLDRLDAWTVRLPSVLLTTITVLAVWACARELLPGSGGLLAAIVLATAFEWVRAASGARVDATLAAFTTIGLLLFWRGFVRDHLSLRTTALAYACFAAAALTKGPVGFLLPGLVLGAALLYQGRLRSLPRYRPMLGVLLVVGLVGAWYFAAWQIGGDAFFRKQVLKENVFRFLGATQMRSGHSHPFWYYVPTLAAGFLPWTPFLLGALVAALRSQDARRDPRTAFLLVWFLVVFVFYSAASGKRSVYLLSLYPPGALLVGWWIEALVREERHARWLETRAARWIALAIVVLLSVPLALVLAEGAGLAPLERIAPFLHEKDQANLPIVRDVIVAHLPTVVGTLVLLVGALATLTRAAAKARWRVVISAASAFAVALWLLVFGVFQPGLADRRSLASFMEDVRSRTGGAPLVFLAPSFDFGAAFYARPAAGYARADGKTAPVSGAWLLVWDLDLAELPDATRATIDVVATSAGTDPKGKRHMVLGRVR